MKMENLLIYYVASYATLLSAFLGFIFSVMVIRSSDCTSKTTAFYIFARNSAKERRRKILSLLRPNPTISAHEIALVLNVSTRTIERDLEWLKKVGAIMRDGADFGRKWVVLHNENLNT